MKALIYAILCVLSLSPASQASSLSDCTGVLRVFGDCSSWMSSCFVVGDGSWVVAPYRAVTETVGPKVDQTLRYPIFISAYTGKAYQCELKTCDKGLGIAVLKLPISGLPAVSLGKLDDFTKAAYGTFGQLTGDDPVGNSWPTDIYGIAAERKNGVTKYSVMEWSARQVFVTDVDKYKMMFLREISPERSVPNGSLIARESVVVGMYLDRLTLTGGKEDITYGRCSMSTEIARYLGDHGVDSSSLYDPPRPTVQRDANSSDAFQLQVSIYSMIGRGVAANAVSSAEALVKLLPQDAQAQMVLGLAYTAVGKFDEAIKAYDEAAKLNSVLPCLKMNRALALAGQNKIAEAEKELTQAAEEAPNDVRPVSALASFYMSDEKRLDDALTNAKKATQMATNSPAQRLLLAKILKLKKEYQASINTIGEAIKMAPDWTDAIYALGSTFEEAGDKKNAEKAYRLLVQKQPKSPAYLMTLASFLADTDRKDEALETLGKIRELNPPKDVLDAVQGLQDKIEGKQPKAQENAK